MALSAQASELVQLIRQQWDQRRTEPGPSWSTLTLPAGSAVVDTAAVQALLGEPALKRLEVDLACWNLRPVELDCQPSSANGMSESG